MGEEAKEQVENKDQVNKENTNNVDNKSQGNNSQENSGLYTKEQVDQLINEAAEKVRNNLINAFGVSPDQTKAIFGVLKGAFGGDQEQKAQSNENELLRLRAQVEAMKLSAKPDKVDNIVILGLARGTQNISDALKEIKKEQPDWFSDTEQGKDKNNGTGTTGQQKGNGTGSAPQGKVGTSAKVNTDDYGKRLAERKKKANAKAKYFI